MIWLRIGTCGGHLVTAVMSLSVPLNWQNFSTVWESVSFPGRTLLRGVG